MSTLHVIHALDGAGAEHLAREIGGTTCSSLVLRASGITSAKAAARIQRAMVADALGRGEVAVACGGSMLSMGNVEKMVALADEVIHHTIDRDPSTIREHEPLSPEEFAAQVAKAYTHDRRHLRRISSRVGQTKDGLVRRFVWRERDLTNPHEVALAEYNRAIATVPGPCVVYDMDGTLVDVDELLRTCRRPNGRLDILAFHRGSAGAPAHDDVVASLHADQRAGKKVVVLTARQSEFFGLTSRWLADHGISPDLLVMRQHDDNRPDYEAKRDMVSEITTAGWDVTEATDDNPQVLRLWAELGITAHPVNQGRWA